MNSKYKWNQQFIGDLIILFNKDEKIYLPTRMENQKWIKTENGKSWQLWFATTVEKCRGFPLYTAVSKEWKLLILGEIYGEKPSVHEIIQVLQDPENTININGHFLIVAYNERTDEWHVITSRFGSMHMYYVTGEGIKAIGTFFPSVAEVSSCKKLDWRGLISFFTTGFFMGNLTFFSDVHILRPATHYIFNGYGHLVKKSRYWEWWHAPNYRRSYQETLEEFAWIFHKVLDEMTPHGKIALPISGGLDSRSTVAGITRPERKIPSDLHIWSYSYGYSKDSIETKIASQVAKARKLNFASYTIKPYIFREIKYILAWTEGFEDITQPRQVFVRDEIAKKADFVISALWGDVWMDDMGLASQKHPLTSYDNDEIVDYILNRIKKPGGDWLVHNLIPGNFHIKKTESALRELLHEEMRHFFTIEDPDFKIKAFKTEHWSFRWSFPPLRVYQSAAFPRLVFYDTRLADFFATVPSSFFIKRRLQIDYLKKYSPDLAKITWQPYGLNLYQLKYFNNLYIPVRAFRKLQRIIGRRKIYERNWEVQFLNEEGKNGLTKWILQKGLRLHEFISPKKLSNFLLDFYTHPTREKGYITSMLLTFSAWLEYYG